MFYILEIAAQFEFWFWFLLILAVCLFPMVAMYWPE